MLRRSWAMDVNSDQNEVDVKTESTCSEQPELEESKVPNEKTKAGKMKKSFLNAVHESGLVAAKTVAGVGIGAAAGIGAVVAIAAAEVTVPALLVVQIFGFAGGAIGFLKGIGKK
jgi:hypothetical protein